MPRALRVCPVPGCPQLTAGGRCGTHRREADQARGSRHERGYGTGWTATRDNYLKRNRWCRLCEAKATVADHYPVSKRDLLAQAVSDPDADHRLRPLCASCHGKETAKHQPGGWNAR